MSRAFYLLFSLLLVAGCSTFLRSPAPEIATGEPPLDIHVVRSLNRAGTLSVFVRLDAKTRVNASAVNLTLVGLDEGEERLHVKKNLAKEIADDYIEVGYPITVNFEVPAAGLAEYQVRAEWGVEPSVAIARSEIVDTKNWCDQTSACFKRAKLLLTLSNDSTRIYNGLNLAIGFHVKGDETAEQTPADLAPLVEGESEIVLSDLNLATGERRPVEIDIDQDIPVETGFEILPYARIISAK